MSRTWQKDSGKCACPMRWGGSFPKRRASGRGNRTVENGPVPRSNLEGKGEPDGSGKIQKSEVRGQRSGRKIVRAPAQALRSERTARRDEAESCASERKERWHNECC